MDSTYEHTEANRPKRILEMLYRNSKEIRVTLNQKTICQLLTIVDRIADMQCCCPTHGALFDLNEYLAGAEPDPGADYGCPGGDCDGCPDCLSGQARRIIVRLGGA